jgi:hypothetical protein
MLNEANGWIEYKRLVLSQLEDLTAEVKELRGDISKLRVDVGQLRVQASAFGALAGLLVGVLMRFAFKL